MFKRSLHRVFSTAQKSTALYQTPCTLLLCVPGKEFLLSQELGSKLSVEDDQIQILKPGIIQIPDQPHIPDLVFALQALPNGKFYTSPAEVNLEFSRKHVITHPIVPKQLKGNFARSAVNNRVENVVKTICKNHSKADAKFISPRQLSWYREKDFNLMQVLSFDRNSFFVSVSAPSPVQHSFWPNLAPAGLQDIHHDLPEAPNSAFRKLQEAMCMLGKFPKFGDTAIDLGGAPGGFASLLLSYQAHVYSIDKGKFEIQGKNLTTARGDAFELQPPFPFPVQDRVDWMTWDVICAPHKLLETLDKVCSQQWTNYFVGMMKFQGDVDWGAIKEAQALEKYGYSVRVKHLFNNKNECTVMISQK